MSILISSLAVLTAACSERTTPTSPTIDASAFVSAATAKGHVVSGTVYSDSPSSDQPLADANVSVAVGDEKKTTRTNARGGYSVLVPAGDATITASKDGYAPKTWTITVAENVVLNFSLVVD